MRKFETLPGTALGLGFAVAAFAAVNLLASALHDRPSQGPGGATRAMAMAAAATVAVAPAVAPPAVAADPTPGELDLAAGERAFKACKACHTIEPGARNGVGPNLWGVLGRAVASHPGYGYSEALLGLGAHRWDAASLDAYLANPRAYVAGTRMTFAGIGSAAERANLIGWLASRPDAAAQPAPMAVAVPAPTAAPDAVLTLAALVEPYADLPDDAIIEIAPVAWPEGVSYADLPPRSDADLAAIAARVAVLLAEVPQLDYDRARYHPLHFQPAIATASSEECLVCHAEILGRQPRALSPAGLAAADSLAWYQTLDTYAGAQADFHWRHIESDFARSVMRLECSFCHQGNDPREESPDMMPGRAAFSAAATPEFTLRKMVNPSETCLLCHGDYPAEVMGLEGNWHELRLDLETAEAPNGCLSCHAELFRTERHNVNYLNAATIEDIARTGTSDACFGCHGGRAWYRIAYPYPRHSWPMMDADTLPDWAENRPTASKPEHQLPARP